MQTNLSPEYQARADGRAAAHTHCLVPGEAEGANDPWQLAQLERAWQLRAVRALCTQGARVLDPARLDIRGTVSVGRDVQIDVNVILEGRVELGDGVSIGPFTRLKDVSLAAGTVVKAHCDLMIPLWEHLWTEKADFRKSELFRTNEMMISMSEKEGEKLISVANQFRDDLRTNRENLYLLESDLNAKYDEILSFRDGMSMLGLLSPPVGLCFFVAAAITGAKPGKMFMVTLPFFGIACVLLILLSIYPFLSLALLK